MLFADRVVEGGTLRKEGVGGQGRHVPLDDVDHHDLVGVNVGREAKW